jgi:UDP-N-acetylmuramyl pentapeptide phosphotransferase/UDP-N-acetylglucosamine-1-phosphate transferase
MPCLLLILGIAFPRLILALLFFFTGYLNRPYRHGFLLPLLGFFFLPLTTLIYAVVINTGNRPEGLYLLALVICALADLGLIGGGVRSRSNR